MTENRRASLDSQGQTRRASEESKSSDSKSASANSSRRGSLDVKLVVPPEMKETTTRIERLESTMLSMVQEVLELKNTLRHAEARLTEYEEQTKALLIYRKNKLMSLTTAVKSFMEECILKDDTTAVQYVLACTFEDKLINFLHHSDIYPEIWEIRPILKTVYGIEMRLHGDSIEVYLGIQFKELA